MLRKSLGISILLSVLIAFACSPEKTNSPKPKKEKNLVSIKNHTFKPIYILSGFTKDKKNLNFLISVEKDFAIQDSEYNDLQLSTNLAKDKPKKLNLTGILRKDKKEYFKIINTLSVPLVLGAKSYHLKGRLFFCNLKKSFCGKKNIDLTVQN